MEFSFQYCSYLLKETLTFTQMCGMNSIPLTNRITFHSNNWLLLPDANQLYLNIWLSQTLTFIKKKTKKKQTSLEHIYSAEEAEVEGSTKTGKTFSN